MSRTTILNKQHVLLLKYMKPHHSPIQSPTKDLKIFTDLYDAYSIHTPSKFHFFQLFCISFSIRNAEYSKMKTSNTL